MSETNNSNEVVVSIKNLQKAFGDNVVLRDIDLDVHKGEVVVVLGPSGSGKSDDARCINRGASHEWFDCRRGRGCVRQGRRPQ